MSKRNVEIKDMKDAMERLNVPREGDHIIVRALSLIVPEQAYDMALMNASMQLMLDNFANNQDSVKKHQLSMCQSGEYEIVAVFHLRRVDAFVAPLLN